MGWTVNVVDNSARPSWARATSPAPSEAPSWSECRR